MAEGQVWTIGRILKWTETYFASHGIASARLDAEVLLAHVLSEKRIYLYVHYDQPLDPAELAAYRGVVKRRASREPVAYIVGAREFMGLSFYVSPAVLVPQPDTETLVGAVMDRLPASGGSVLDLGTGSGAIALSLLHFMPSLSAVAVDVSRDALRVAQENAASLGVADRVRFCEGDLFAPLSGERFTAIASNPPYIPRADLDGLPPEVRAEPHLALDGGADGLVFYRRIVDEARAYVEDGGFVAVEVGHTQAAEVARLAKDAGWGRVEVVEDLAGVARVVVLWG